VTTAGGLTCRELVELVTDYLEDRLSVPARASFEEHLASCNGCQAYVEQMRLTLRALGRLPEEQLSGRAREAMLAAFRDWRAGRA
jgi:anti-sigma factor RsiW